MTKIYKIKNDYDPPLTHSLFTSWETTFNLRNFHEIITEKKNTVNHGVETESYGAAYDT